MLVKLRKFKFTVRDGVNLAGKAVEDQLWKLLANIYIYIQIFITPKLTKRVIKEMIKNT